MRDFGQPEDVGNAVTSLVSPRARYITGIVLTVDGGMPLPLLHLSGVAILPPGSKSHGNGMKPLTSVGIRTTGKGARKQLFDIC